MVIHVNDRFFTVQRPERCSADGLFECFKRAFSFVGVDNWKSKLIGFGCDGASVNIAASGLRGHLEEAVPWVTVFWCFVHRLELAIKEGKITSDLATFCMTISNLFHTLPHCRGTRDMS